MIDTDLDRRLQRWMADREPASVPPTVRQLARDVAEGSAMPLAWRVRGVLGPGPVADAPRMALVLALLSLLLAAVVAGVLVGGSSQPAPLPSVDQWGAFVVGQPAPKLAWRGSGPEIVGDDDQEVEFEDLVGSVVVVIAPSGGDMTTGLTEAEAVRERIGSGRYLIVGARTVAEFTKAARTGTSAMDLTAATLVDAFPPGEPAVVVIDQRGRVARIFAGVVPDADQLAEIVTSLEGPQ